MDNLCFDDIARAVHSLDGTDATAKAGILRLIKQTQCSKPSLDLSKIEEPSLLPYSSNSFATPDEIEAILHQIAIVKLSGGSGKKWGCAAPKFLTILVDKDHEDNSADHALNMLDITVKQVEVLNDRYNCNIPLYIMDSFKSHHPQSLNKYEQRNVRVTFFTQLKYPQLDGRCMPLPTNSSTGDDGWCNSGHGDVFESLIRNGIVDKLLSQGKNYVLISNMNNLGGSIDWNIAKLVVSNKYDFCMEVTPRTAADISKGGSLISYKGRLQLLEYLQAHSEGFGGDFNVQKKYDFHNTNNLWVDLRAIKKLFERSPPELDIIDKYKAGVKAFPDRAVLELKTVAGSAIKHFPNSCGISVPRSRFLPVRCTADLMILQSDIYNFSPEDGLFVRSSLRGDRADPIIKLEGPLEEIAEYRSRFGMGFPTGYAQINTFELPKIMDLDSLTISGDVYFSKGVTLKGNVTIKSMEVPVTVNSSTLQNEDLEM